ncbi:MAG: hypothetical protein NXI24_17805 [bacterium]|nr:hypothetical protein [bacterium]
MADQKVRVLVERLGKGRVRLRFLSREAAAHADAAARDEGPGLLTGGVIESGLLGHEALLASIALGHMEAYAALCERNDLRIEVYRDDAVAMDRYSDDAEFPGTHVLLRPRLAFFGADSSEARATAIRLLNEALGQSVFFEAPRITIEIDPVFEFQNLDTPKS